VKINSHEINNKTITLDLSTSLSRQKLLLLGLCTPMILPPLSLVPAAKSINYLTCLSLTMVGLLGKKSTLQDIKHKEATQFLVNLSLSNS